MRITIVSVRSPTIPAIIAAASKIKIITSLNCASSIRAKLFFLPSSNSLGPVCNNFSSAAIEVKPCWLMLINSKISGMLNLCQFILLNLLRKADMFFQILFFNWGILYIGYRYFERKVLLNQYAFCDIIHDLENCRIEKPTLRCL